LQKTHSISDHLELISKIIPTSTASTSITKIFTFKKSKKKKILRFAKKKKFAWLFAEKKESVDPPHISAAQFSALCVGGHFPLDSLKKSQKKKGSLF